MQKHEFATPEGHLEQVFVANVQGNWASANAQLRTFFDVLLDGIAEKLDPSIDSLNSGKAQRSKLGFLSIELNEWDNNGKGFIKGLFKRLHPNGAHPGLSNDGIY